MGFNKLLIFTLCILLIVSEFSFSMKIGRLKYKGGGDWYNDPSIIPDLAKEVYKLANIKIDSEQKVVQFEDDSVFETPFVFVTGHGNIKFDGEDRKKLKMFLSNGGFMYVDDDYGLDKYFRKEIESIFGKGALKRLPMDFELFNIYYDFSKSGIPKVHEHYKGPPEVYGLWVNGRCSLIYTYNTNISDGWTPVHKDPLDIRNKAFKFGVNLILYFFTR